MGMTNNRIGELDSLRGVWAILILLFHATQATIFAGWPRVDLFFVLAGYVLTSQLIKPGYLATDGSRIVVRRLLRLLPAYYILLAAVVIGDGRRCEPDHFAGMLLALTLSQNTQHYWGGTISSYSPRFLAHTWALENILQFSLLWPMLFRLVGRHWLIPLTFWVLINAVVLRACGLHPWTLLARCDGFALGALLALLSDAPACATRRSTTYAVLLTATLAGGYLGWFLASPVPVPLAFDRPLVARESLAVFASNYLYAGLIGLIVVHSGRPALGILRVRLFCYLGRISYGIYLYSFAAIWLVEEVLRLFSNTSTLCTAPLVLTLSVALAAASSTIERPMQRLGRRMLK